MITIANIEVLKDLLLMKGYSNIVTTTDSRNLIDIVLDFKPNILLLDLLMPFMTGLEIMAELKKQNLLSAYMPILVLTADATSESKQQALSGGASDFVTKPFNLAEVNLRIKNLLMNVYLMSQIQEQNNILEEKVLERTSELMKSNDAISKQNEVLKEIAWIQSHVVRAPLSRMMGLITLLRDNDETSGMPNELVLEHIVSSANELDNTIKEITLKAFDANIFEDEKHD
jgi:DNA-binding response OmpR family regulator